VQSKSNGVCPVTVSVGVGMMNDRNYKQAIATADKAMYHAKISGRNQVVSLKG